jgi:hypothetical protein
MKRVIGVTTLNSGALLHGRYLYAKSKHTDSFQSLYDFLTLYCKLVNVVRSFFGPDQDTGILSFSGVRALT